MVEITTTNSLRSKFSSDETNGANRLRVNDSSDFVAGEYAVFVDSEGLVQNIKVNSVATGLLYVDTSTWTGTGDATSGDYIYVNNYATVHASTVSYTNHTATSTTFTHRPTSNPGGGIYSSVAFTERTFS